MYIVIHASWTRGLYVVCYFMNSFHLAKTYIPPPSPLSSEASDEVPEKEQEEAPKGNTLVIMATTCKLGSVVMTNYRAIKNKKKLPYALGKN